MTTQSVCEFSVERLDNLPRLARRVQEQALLACQRAAALRANLRSIREQRAAALARAPVPLMPPRGLAPAAAPAPQEGLDRKLTPRMRQILELLMLGHSEKEAAAVLRVSPHTVHIHVTRMYGRLRVRSRAELLAMAYLTRYAPPVTGSPARGPSPTAA